MIDTHCHLGEDIFRDDLDAVISRAKQAGITGCVVPGEHSGNVERIQEIAHAYPDFIRPALGLYPTSATREELERFKKALEAYEWAGIGEIGLDAWMEKEADRLQMQEDIFREVIRLGKMHHLPLNIHSRSAARRAVEILCEENAEMVHMHAFDAKPSTVRMGIEAGFYFSIPTSIFYAPQKQKLARLVPLSQMLLETDSPYMAVERNARNEPAFVAPVVGAIAEIKGVLAEEVEAATTANARALYWRA